MDIQNQKHTIESLEYFADHKYQELMVREAAFGRTFLESTKIDFVDRLILGKIFRYKGPSTRDKTIANFIRQNSDYLAEHKDLLLKVQKRVKSSSDINRAITSILMKDEVEGWNGPLVVISHKNRQLDLPKSEVQTWDCNPYDDPFLFGRDSNKDEVIDLSVLPKDDFNAFYLIVEWKTRLGSVPSDPQSILPSDPQFIFSAAKVANFTGAKIQWEKLFTDEQLTAAVEIALQQQDIRAACIMVGPQQAAKQLFETERSLNTLPTKCLSELMLMGFDISTLKQTTTALDLAIYQGDHNAIDAIYSASCKDENWVRSLTDKQLKAIANRFKAPLTEKQKQDLNSNLKVALNLVLYGFASHLIEAGAEVESLDKVDYLTLLKGYYAGNIPPALKNAIEVALKRASTAQLRKFIDLQDWEAATYQLLSGADPKVLIGLDPKTILPEYKYTYLRGKVEKAQETTE